MKVGRSYWIKICKEEGRRTHSSKIIKPLLLMKTGYLGMNECWGVEIWCKNLNLIERFSYQPTDILTYMRSPKDFLISQERQSAKAEMHIYNHSSGTSRFKSMKAENIWTKHLLEFLWPKKENNPMKLLLFSRKDQITKGLYEMQGDFMRQPV